MGVGYGECVESSGAGYLHDSQLLPVWVDLGAEGCGGIFELDGEVELLSGEWICVRLFGWQSIDLLQRSNRTDGTQQRACDQH
jgi:hypothetical protein